MRHAVFWCRLLYHILVPLDSRTIFWYHWTAIPYSGTTGLPKRALRYRYTCCTPSFDADCHTVFTGEPYHILVPLESHTIFWYHWTAIACFEVPGILVPCRLLVMTAIPYSGTTGQPYHILVPLDCHTIFWYYWTAILYSGTTGLP